MPRSDAEQLHYAGFYADRADTGTDDRPRVVVVGNCQAESLRVLLDDDDVSTVRLPPIHEIEADDVPRLTRLLARTEVLVTQPVGADYRGLPLGTEQLVPLLPASARVVRVPPVRYHGLHPWHVVAHPPGLADPDPPVAAYHDLRTLAVALAPADRRREDLPVATPEALRAVADGSVAELRRREELHGTVVAHDLFATPAPALMRTVNHPGNAVLVPLAARVRAAAGLAARANRVERPLLDAVHAPVEAPVLAALGLDDAPRPDWHLHGRAVTDEEVAAAHLAFYADRPDVVALLVERYAPLMRSLGLG